MGSVAEDRQASFSPGLAIKQPVRAATLIPLAYPFNGLQTVDGVILAALDRVLVKNQADPTQNGVWDVQTGIWTRSADFDGKRDVAKGTIMLVLEGTQAQQFYQVTSPNPIIPGTSALTFSLSLTASSTIMSFLAAGAGAVQRTAQTKMRDIVSIKDYGAVGDDVNDDTAAISAAITAVQAVASRPALWAPGGTYLVTDQLTTIPGQFTLYGEGRQQTKFHFKPTADKSCFRLSNGAAQVINVFLRDFSIYSDDAGHTKKAIEINDCTTCGFENLYIYGNGAGVVGSPAAGLYFSGGTGSKGIEINGRDSSYIRGCEIVADYPIYIGANPNSAATNCEDCDHWHFSDLYLLASGHYAITVLDGHGVADLTIDGFQAWVGGTGGFFMNDTRAAPVTYSHGISIKNVRTEQLTDPNGYAVNISAAFRIGDIGLENVFADVSSQGIKISRVLMLHLNRVTAATAAAKDCLNVTNPDSDSVVVIQNCVWQLGSVFTLAGYTATMIAAFNATDFQGPSTAVYVANTNQAGTSLTVGGKVNAKVAATTVGLETNATGGGDRLQLIPGAAGNGSILKGADDAIAVFRPINVQALYFGMLNCPLVLRRVVVTYSASMTIDASTGSEFDISDNNGTAFTINAPTNPVDGQRITVTLRNISGGALGAATWNAVFKMSAWTNPANGNSRSIDFRYDGTNWVQVAQTGVDVPN